MEQEELVGAALRSFRRLAEPIGLKLGTYSATVLSARSDPGQVTLRLTDGERVLLLQWVENPDEAEALIKGAKAQEAARRALLAQPDTVGLRVPKVLAAGPSAKAVLVELAQGRKLEARLQDGEDPVPLLARTGTWVSALHRATFSQDRDYQPRFMLGHVARLAEDAVKRPASLPDQPEFLRYCAAFPDHAGPAEGYPVPSAQSHGDLGLRSVFVSGTEVSAVGFKPGPAVPVAFDVARLVTDVLQVVTPPPDAAPFTLPPSVLDGFFSTYTLIRPDDPVLTFLLKVRLLAEWRAIPGNPSMRSWRQDRRWAVIRAMAPLLLK